MTRIPAEDPEEVRKRDRAGLKAVGWNHRQGTPKWRIEEDPRPAEENGIRELEDADDH